MELNVSLDLVRDSATTFQQSNIPRQLTKARERLLAAVKALYKYKRQPATHVFVFMISHGRRNQKPYTIPMQCVPLKKVNFDDS